MFVHRIKDTNHTDYKYFYFFNLHQIEITLYDILMNCCLSNSFFMNCYIVKFISQKKICLIFEANLQSDQ